MIKVFIIDDSMLIRNQISKMLKNDVHIELHGVASNPIEAMYFFQNNGFPDVIILDLEMPKMDGLTFLKKLYEEKPIPTIVFSSFSHDFEEQVEQLQKYGAKDYVIKSSAPNAFLDETFCKMFIQKIHHAYLPLDTNGTKIKEFDSISYQKEKIVIAMGASTGGVQTLEKIITQLSANHPPILITQHMPEGFTTTFANRLNKISPYSTVKEAISNEIIANGTVYIAPGNLHLEIEKIEPNVYKTVLKDYPKVSNHKPSVDVLFTSFAKQVGVQSVAFILTGMGKDGALGIKKIKESGGKTYGQDEESCVVYGMPKVAFAMGAIDKQVSINEVVDIINNLK